ncbi:hypothetical protein Golax_021785 [Gossypium laxum]|uniref:Reverse transcriptase zinc-binding domain-containing protein n=1 Tax=Gossypium laxum TaxID=34288 RepID=A0A7J9AML2_9ROSI|nr:hypothetical protein [Gossypium laxum]
MKDSEDWNRASMRKHIKTILVGEGFLWISGLQAYALKGNTLWQRAVLNWQLELHWANSRLKGKTSIMLIMKLSWNAFIYMIWRERNKRHFKGLQANESEVLQNIRGTVQTRWGGKY